MCVKLFGCPSPCSCVSSVCYSLNTPFVTILVSSFLDSRVYRDRIIHPKQDGVHRRLQLNEPVTVRGTRKSAGPVQLIFVSAGPAQRIFVSAGPAQLIFAGPAQLVFVSAGSAQFRATRAPPGTPGLVSSF